MENLHHNFLYHFSSVSELITAKRRVAFALKKYWNSTFGILNYLVRFLKKRHFCIKIFLYQDAAFAFTEAKENTLLYFLSGSTLFFGICFFFGFFGFFYIFLLLYYFFEISYLMQCCSNYTKLRVFFGHFTNLTIVCWKGRHLHVSP